MGKTVYSIVLLEEVVAKVDKLAYKSGTSRSSIVNKILAEHVSYITPENQIKDIFSQMEESLSEDESFRKIPGGSDAFSTYYSSLDYKYNPSVRYMVEIFEVGSYIRGEIRVGLRSQSSSLLNCFSDFFSRWGAIEQGRNPRHQPDFVNGKYVRPFVFDNTVQDNVGIVGASLAEYIQTVDRSMKAYFRYLDNTGAACRQMESFLNDFIRAVENESWFLKL